jgi:hypothetical protein
MSSWIKIKGTQTGSFQLGLSGPTLNNNSGNLQLRNSANTANADISVGNVAGNVITGNLLTGTLTTAAQPNITSVGTLTSLSMGSGAISGPGYTFYANGVGLFQNSITTGYIDGTLRANSNDQPFITSLGNLTSLKVVGTSNVGNLTINGIVDFSNSVGVIGNIIPVSNVTYSLGSSTNRFKDLWLSGNTIQLGDTNISTSGNGIALPSANVTTDLSVGGNATITGNTVIAGNLTVAGTTTYVNSTNTTIVDPIIELGGGANGAALLTSDGKDRGTLLHYAVGNTVVDGFMGWKSANSEFTFASNASVSNNVATINTLGNVRVGNIIATNLGNLSSLNKDGNASNVLYGNGVFAAAPSGGGNSSYGDSNVTSLLTSGNITGNITIGNNTGTYANIELRGIYSKISAPYVSVYNEVGTIAINSSSISNDANLALKSAANVNIQVFTGNGYSNIISVIGDYPSYTNAARVAIAGNVAITGNVSATNLGNIVTINKDGNSSNVLYGNGVFAAAPSGGGNIATDYWRTTSKSLTYSSNSQVALLTLPANATVDKVTIIVDTAFNGNSPGATVGRSFGGTGLEYVSTGDVDLKTADRYDLPCQIAPTGNTVDIVINYTASSSTAGSARVLITYAVAS